MKTIGLIGGMSWESSAQYYRILNEGIRSRLGGLHSARTLMLSVDFAPIEQMQAQRRWGDAARELAGAAQALERGGADCVVLCTNTMHKLADAISGAIRIPLLHIADAAAIAVQKAGLQCVGLLGTRFTMEEDFYIQRLERKAKLNVLVPPAVGRERVDRVIYDELCMGKVLGSSREAYLEIIGEMVERGAEGIILGCTEIMLLVGECRSEVPFFDTTGLHAEAAIEFALAPEAA
jgi:aspartate racemase